MRIFWFLGLGLVAAILVAEIAGHKNTTAPLNYGYKVLNSFPHDPEAFTQGLVYQDGNLYEGTGRWGHSTLRRTALESGRVLQSRPLEPRYFGEGITLQGNRIVQLTWRSNTGFIYDKESFQPLRRFSYPREGWGLTFDGERLIMSDGSATLSFLDPETLETTGQVEVHDDRGPVTRLNELEYVAGEVFANVWQSDRIARIDPDTGQVTGWIDLSGLLPAQDHGPTTGVLNGIAAYPGEGERLLVTGKLWPKLFEIELQPPPLVERLRHWLQWW